LVTLNYRLGLFGFFTHSELTKVDSENPTNFGLLDQILALKWVKMYISYFGGNPDDVTVFGTAFSSLAPYLPISLSLYPYLPISLPLILSLLLLSLALALSNNKKRRKCRRSISRVAPFTQGSCNKSIVYQVSFLHIFLS
jgi:Carboxylesterase family